ncbi:hypothetical protein CBM2634_A200155 [Cupriavidus taiwanensis]|uniref:Uncharacterized protein n=1 Tax=Cupriavidus taiwanensis TaxID=164546 RepID=A0A375J1S5_9BURK|nr:hypothetical protein CBM2634_A200155 [Cupriavidus taiwanensis]
MPAAMANAHIIGGHGALPKPQRSIRHRRLRTWSRPYPGPVRRRWRLHLRLPKHGPQPCRTHEAPRHGGTRAVQLYQPGRRQEFREQGPGPLNESLNGPHQPLACTAPGSRIESRVRGRRIMAITLASQAKDVGSIPIARSTSSRDKPPLPPLR